MFTRIARSAGSAPTPRPNASARPTPIIQLTSPAAGRLSAPPLPALTAGPMMLANSRPMTPPISSSSTDSASTMPSRLGPEKPRVLSTAISPVRSRTACIMVLPASSSSVKNTAPMIDVTIRLMSATCFIQLLIAACSVMVRVSWSELADSSSMALSTRSAWFTSFTCVTYQPTWPLFHGVVSSKYFQFNRNISSYQAPDFLSATWMMPTILNGQFWLPFLSGKMVDCMGI
mmetsp:Transcript_44842/g.105636  ORF Transcript_44842/g.105636 Transcript_44842/m.105636 type:complete len:231 (+) Transcript_44842:480-1172(+)